VSDRPTDRPMGRPMIAKVMLKKQSMFERCVWCEQKFGRSVGRSSETNTASSRPWSTRSPCPSPCKATSSTKTVSNGLQVHWWSSTTFLSRDCRRSCTDPSSICSQTHHASESATDLRWKLAKSGAVEGHSSVLRCPFGTRWKR
jgi:hypothetical protein